MANTPITLVDRPIFHIVDDLVFSSNIGPGRLLRATREAANSTGQTDET
jgi:hypothetical protein